jgi:hypothetical protein
MSFRQLLNHRIFMSRNVSFMVMIVVVLLVLCMLQQLPSSQFLYVHGQITDPRNVQIGDEIWYVKFPVSTNIESSD